MKKLYKIKSNLTTLTVHFKTSKKNIVMWANLQVFKSSLLVLAGIFLNDSAAQTSLAPPIELTCEFRILAVVEVRDYGCLLEHINLDIETNDPVRILGEHVEGRGVLDVKVLEIHDSMINTIPSLIFFQLPNIEALEILRSGTFALEARSFFFANNLRDIRINNNNIPRVTGSPFAYAKNLEMIFLFDNQIVEIESTVFLGLNKLFHLSIGVNKISQMSAAHFAPLKSLERIYMIQNEIEVVGNDWFGANPLLTDIDIEYNKISSIGSNFLDGLENLDYVLLSNNLCVNKNFKITEDFTIDDVRSGLQECFDNFVAPPISGGNFTFELHGNLTIFDVNGDQLLRIVN